MHRFVLSVTLCVVAGCASSGGPFDFAAPRTDGGALGGPAFERCGSFCVRPGDCAIAYPDDDRCPGGFVCSRVFRCVSDGGAD